MIRRDGLNSLHIDGINRVYHVYIHSMRHHVQVLRPIRENSIGDIEN